MGVAITTQDAARRVLKRSARCYLCGEPLPQFYLNDEEFERTSPYVDREHVVAEGIFEEIDRANFPLLLSTHKTCNSGESRADQKLAEVFQLMWKRETETDLQTAKLQWNTDATGRATSSSWKDVDLTPMVFRWIRGFHYALYDEYLLRGVSGAVMLPFLRLDNGKEQETGQYLEMARQIERQRATDQLDRITAYNGRLCYECFWFVDAGMPTCVFALEVNGWSIFSDPRNIGDRRCGIGCYRARDIPAEASRATQLAFPSGPTTLDLFPALRERYIRKGGEQVMKTVTYRGKPYGASESP